jgi:hypothetical protein
VTTKTAPALRPASTKQTGYIDTLLGNREISDELAEHTRTVVGDGVSVRQASEIINWLMALPKRAEVPADRPSARVGYYVRTEQTGDTPDCEAARVVYVVVLNKAETNTYAKRLVISSYGSARWEYAPRVGSQLAAEGLQPLTAEEAAELGHLHGVCVVCTRQLTDPSSVERGIGPVCSARLREHGA